MPVLLLRPLRAAIVVSVMVAVTTPVVLVSIVLAWATVALPVTVAITAAAVSIVVALMAVAMSAAEPVSVPTEPALTLTVVLPSRVLRAAASTDESLIEMV